MSRRWRRAAVLLGAALVPGSFAPADAQNPPALELSVRLKPLRVEIGDPVRADLELVVPAGLAVGRPIFPSWSTAWGEAEVVAVEPPTAEPVDGGATRFRQTVTLIPWRTGEMELPTPSVELPTADEILQVTTLRPTVFTVGSVLPEGDERPAPKPPAPPLPFPTSGSFWWTLGVAVIACVAAAGLLVRRRRAAAAASARAVVDPLTGLRRSLAELEAQEDPRALIAGLSLALRRYLGARLGFPAAESTTTEIRHDLQKRALPSALVLAVDRLLKRCDAIKFARRPIAREACAGPLAEVADLAARVEAYLRPAAESSDGEADREREAA